MTALLTSFLLLLLGAEQEAARRTGRKTSRDGVSLEAEDGDASRVLPGTLAEEATLTAAAGRSYYFDVVSEEDTKAILVDIKALAQDAALLPTATAQYNHRMTGAYNFQTRVKWAGIEIPQAGGGTCTDQCLFNSTNLATTIADKKAKIASNFQLYLNNIKTIEAVGVNSWCANWGQGVHKYNVGRKLTIPLEDKPDNFDGWCKKLYNYDTENKSSTDCDGKYIVTYSYKSLYDKMKGSFPENYDQALQKDCRMLMNKFLGHWHEAEDSTWTKESENFGSQSMYLILDKVGSAVYNGHDHAAFSLFQGNGVEASHKLKIVGISQDGSKAKGPEDADLCWTVGITFPSDKGGGLIVQRFNSVAEAKKGSAVISLMTQDPQFSENLGSRLASPLTLLLCCTLVRLLR